MKRSALFLLFLLGVCPWIIADVVTMKDGTVRDGKIVKEDSTSITLRIEKGSISAEQKILRADIATIEKTRTKREIYEEKVADTDPVDAAAQEKLARWCEENKLTKEAAQHWQIVLRTKPDNTSAVEGLKRLGYLQEEDGRWVEEREYWTARGHENYKGEWLPKEEAEQRRKEEADSDRIEDLEKELASLEKDLDRLNDRIDDAEKDLRAAEKKLKEYADPAKDLEKDIRKLEAEKKAADAKVEKYSENRRPALRDEAQHESRQLEKEIQKLDKKLAQLENKASRYDRDRAEAEEKLAEYEEEQKELTAEQLDTQKEIAELKGEPAPEEEADVKAPKKEEENPALERFKERWKKQREKRKR